MNNFYVYGLINPTDSTIFYIGMGQKNRMFKHEQMARRHKVSNKNYKLYDVLRSIIDSGNDVIYKIIFDKLDYSTALKLEAAEIKRIGLNHLCNLNEGGSGRSPGYKHSLETRMKIAKSNTGKLKSEHTKRLIGLSKIGNTNMLGKIQSTAAKQKLSESWKTRDLSSYKIAQIHRRKQVIQLDMDGNVIKIWESVTKAINEIGASVSDALYGRQKMAHGYIWKFKDDWDDV